jgi:hypothetical protein
MFRFFGVGWTFIIVVYITKGIKVFFMVLFGCGGNKVEFAGKYIGDTVTEIGVSGNKVKIEY